MSSFNRIISFGPSVSTTCFLPREALPYAYIVANKLKKPHICLAEKGAANTGILRQILSYDDYKNDLVIVMWSNTVRYEFRYEDVPREGHIPGWYQVGPRNKDRFAKEWFRGPGQYEYTEVYTTLRDILTAKQFLESKNLKYLFMFDFDNLITSTVWKSGDNLINNLKKLFPYKNTLWFNGRGFTDWSKDQGYSFINTHPGVEAHQDAADYILKHLNNFIIN